MKKKIIYFSTVLMLLLLMLPTFSSVLRDIFEVFGFKIKNVTGDYVLKTFLSIKTYIKFFTIIDPLNGIGWFIGGYTIYSVLIGSFGLFRPKETYTQTDEYGSHGTARWLTVSEIKKKYYTSKFGWFLGSYEPNKLYSVGMNAAYHILKQALNMQIFVVGPPGSNKTTGFILPNIFHIADIYSKIKENADMIITDPKSELYCLTAGYLEKVGYEVKVLDFIHLKYGDSLNPLHFVTEEKELMELGDGYIDAISAAKGVKRSGEDFYPESAGQLLGALIGYVIQTRPVEKRTFTEVAKILTSEDVVDPEKAKVFFDNANIKGAALQLWNNFLMADDKTRANILIGLATKLKLFAVEGVQNITNSSTIDITKFGAKKDKPIALFIFMPPKDKTFAPIINVMVTTLLNQMYKTSYKYKNKLYNPVYILLEEMANIGRLSNIEEMLGTMRGLKMYPMLIWQSISQMRSRYPDSWEDILSQCDTHVYLGVNDKFTSEYCSFDLGDTTIKIQGDNKKYDGLFGGNTHTESNNYMERRLQKPDECRRLAPEKMYLVPRGSFPSILYKVQYRYWEEYADKKICEEKDVFKLPRILNSDYENITDSLQEVISVMKLTHKELEIESIENRDIGDGVEFEIDQDLEDIEYNIENNDIERDFEITGLKNDIENKIEIEEFDIDI